MLNIPGPLVDLPDQIVYWGNTNENLLQFLRTQYLVQHKNPTYDDLFPPVIKDVNIMF